MRECMSGFVLISRYWHSIKSEQKYEEIEISKLLRAYCVLWVDKPRFAVFLARFLFEGRQSVGGDTRLCIGLPTSTTEPPLHENLCCVPWVGSTVNPHRVMKGWITGVDHRDGKSTFQRKRRRRRAQQVIYADFSERLLGKKASGTSRYPTAVWTPDRIRLLSDGGVLSEDIPSDVISTAEHANQFDVEG